jgi:RHS repeat-associated protein
VRYHYNSLGERIAKTVYPQPDAMKKVNTTSAPDQPGITMYSLFRNQRLAAETDAGGRIIAHYIHLNGKPVAKIEMTPDTSLPHRLVHQLKTLADRITAAETDATDSIASIYAIHTDHLGTPQVVTDAGQHIVWQARTSAFGEATIVHARHADAGHTPFTMDLRLPGQVFDAETGLHYNYQRDYDPRLGRYLTPDPLGLGGGVNPYDYVRGNPLTGVDPLGLYEEDVHYYMTYFLALTAGLPPKQAWVIAMGDRYIDDNPYTEPFGVLGTNLNARADYHFTQAGFDPAKPTGMTNHEYQAYRINNPLDENTQLQELRNYAVNAPTVCAKAQLYGEFLHAFEDTFAHRNAQNAPYDPAGGHALALDWPGHAPDKTYNQSGWTNNATRTLEMEKETFALLKKDFGREAVDKEGFPITWEYIQSEVIKFNEITVAESFAFSKAKSLSKIFQDLGIDPMKKYDQETARKCRISNLSIPNKLYGYPKAILDTPGLITEKTSCE